MKYTATPMAEYYVVARSYPSQSIYGVTVRAKRGLSYGEAVDLAAVAMREAIEKYALGRLVLAGVTHGEVLDATGVYFMQEIVFDYPAEDLV